MFSIIMPAYNAEKTIIESIYSVINQNFKDFELLIIDDCSTDETVQTIKNHIKSDKRIQLLENTQNMGVALTRNIGIMKAKYPYICFLDSDDLWDRNKLTSFYNEFQKGSSVLYSYYTRFGDSIPNKLVKAPSHINYKNLLRGNCIGNLTGAYDSRKIGKVLQKPIHHEDYLMWLEILKKSAVAHCIPHNLASYRVCSQSLSGNKIKSILWTWDIYTKELHLNKLYSFYLLLQNIKNSIFKRII